MRLDPSRSAPWLLVAATLVTFATLLLPSIDLATARHFQDDALFYNIVARNILAGLGSTSDGLGVTNGYHPLWMLCVLAFEALPGPGLLWELLALLVVNTLSAWLLLTWLRLRVGPMPALAVALLLTCIPSAFRLMWTGMEASLALAALLGLLHAIDAAKRGRDGIAVPLLVVALVFARLDGMLAWPALAWVGWTLHQGADEPRALRIRRIARWLGPSLVLTACYGAWNWQLAGTALPISGLIKRLPLTAPLTLEPAYWRDAWSRLSLMVDVTTLRGWTDAIAQRAGVTAGLPWLHGARILGLIAAMTLGIKALQRRRSDDPARTLLLLYVALHLAYYTLFQRDRWSTQWARGPELLVMAAAAAATLAWWREAKPKLAGPLTALAVAAILLVSPVVRLSMPPIIKDFRVSWGDFRAGVDLIASQTGPGERLVSRNIGLLGYHAKRPIVSRDGLLNSLAYHDQALVPGRIGTFLRAHEVGWIVDAVPSQGRPLDHLLRGYPGVRADELELVAVFGPTTASALQPRRYAIARLHWQEAQQR